MNINRYNLLNIIKKDFFYHKIHLLLLVAILLSANSIIFVVYHTHLLVTQKEQFIIIKQADHILWNNLIIEKNRIIKLYKNNLYTLAIKRKKYSHV